MGQKKNAPDFSELAGTLSSQHRRRFILDFLNHTSGYKSNHRVLQDASEQVGLTCCLGAMNRDLLFLEQHQLVELHLYEDYQVVTLLERGLDVSNGVVEVNDIASFRPKR